MSPFTPGPWIVNTDNGQLGDVSTEDRKYAIALAQEISVDDKIRHKSEIRIANAHLISAAPDMYEALMAVPSIRTDAPEWIRFYDLANKALAKADGCA